MNVLSGIDDIKDGTTHATILCETWFKTEFACKANSPGNKLIMYATVTKSLACSPLLLYYIDINTK